MTDTNDDRDTLPPSPASEPPPALSIMPSDTLKRMAGYDDSLFLHVALAAAADGAHEMREARKANDIGTLLEEQTKTILKETGADIGLIRSSILGLQQSVDALVTRIGNTETALDAGTKHFERLDSGIAELNVQMADLRTRLNELEAEQTRLKAGGIHVAESPAPATG